MLAPPNTNLLSNFPVLRSKDPDQVEDALIRVYGARRFDLLDRDTLLDVRADHWQSRSIGLSYCRYGAGVTLTFPAADFCRQLFCISGAARVTAGRHTIDAHPNSFPVLPAGVPISTLLNANYEQIVLRVDQLAVHRATRTLYGSASEFPLPLRANTLEVESRQQGLVRILKYFLQEISCPDGEVPGAALEEVEEAILLSFVSTNVPARNFTHNASDAPAWLVRRIEDYIEAHWSEAVTIERLCQLTTLSARSIFHQFRRTRGYTPLGFLRKVRLRHARAMLSATDSTTSVTTVAFACGFSNLGHFAKSYFISFGERPSETLNRARRSN